MGYRIYLRLPTINLYRIATKHVHLELIPRTWQVKSEDFDKTLKFACSIGKGDFTFKAEKQSNVSTMVKMYSCGYPWDLGSPSATRLPFVFNYKHSDSGTSSGCCRVTPCVSDNESLRRINTLRAVYLLWLFLRITTMCNLYIIRLVHQRFPESVAHAQTVDTRPLFPPPTWPGYEARQAHVTQLFDIYAHEVGGRCSQT